MELHQLRYVAAVARTGNFSRAAAQCHVSQPSLSQQIHKLEDELGERLFDRLKSRARLTRAGETLYARADRILAEVEARREVGEAHALARRSVRMGVLPTIAPHLVPRILPGFGQQFPGVEVVVQEDTTAQLLIRAPTPTALPLPRRTPPPADCRGRPAAGSSAGRATSAFLEHLQAVAKRAA